MHVIYVSTARKYVLICKIHKQFFQCVYMQDNFFNVFICKTIFQCKYEYMLNRQYMLISVVHQHLEHTVINDSS